MSRRRQAVASLPPLLLCALSFCRATLDSSRVVKADKDKKKIEKQKLIRLERYIEMTMCVCVCCYIFYEVNLILNMHMYMYICVCACGYVVITHATRCLRCAVLPYGGAPHYQLLPLSGNTKRKHTHCKSNARVPLCPPLALYSCIAISPTLCPVRRCCCCCYLRLGLRLCSPSPSLAFFHFAFRKCCAALIM